MHPQWPERAEGIINEAMAGQTTQSDEARTDEFQAVMAALSGSGMTCVQMAVVDPFQLLWLQALQALPQLIQIGFHGLSSEGGRWRVR